MRRKTSQWVMTGCLAAAILVSAGGCSGCYESHSAGDAEGDGDTGQEDFAEPHETVDPPEGMEPGYPDAADGFDNLDLVIDLDVYEPFPDPGDPDPWVPDTWDVPFDYMDIPADYVPDPAACGNGVVDPGEECDDGNTVDHDECTNRCLFPRCGDGSVWYGMEDCDPPGTVRPCATACGTTGGEWCGDYCRWTGECVPPREVCGNGIDDDCDGVTDVIARLTPNVRVSDRPIGYSLSTIVWTGSEFAIAWYSYVGSEILTTVDSFGRRTDWDKELYDDGILKNMYWTGSSIGIFYVLDVDYHFNFRSFTSRGLPLSDELTIYGSYEPNIFTEWTGTQFGVVLKKQEDYAPTVFYAVSSDGSSISDEVLLRREYYNMIYNLRWTGSQLALLYSDGGALERKIDTISPVGAITGTVSLDLPSEVGVVSNADVDSFWSGMGLVGGWRIEYSRIILTINGPDGALASRQDVASARPYTIGDLVQAEGEIGLFWTDTRDTSHEIYFVRAAADASAILGEARLTRTPGDSDFPTAAWTGSSYGVVWSDSDGVDEAIYFAHFEPCP